MTSPVSASLSTAPYADGPGLPREPPSASIEDLAVRGTGLAHRPDSAVRTRIRWHSSQRTTSSSGLGADHGELGGVEGQPAAAALAGAQLGGADAALVLAQLGRRAPAGRSGRPVDRRRALGDDCASSASIAASFSSRAAREPASRSSAAATCA